MPMLRGVGRMVRRRRMGHPQSCAPACALSLCARVSFAPAARNCGQVGRSRCEGLSDCVNRCLHLLCGQVTHPDDYQRLLDLAPSPANALEFCQARPQAGPSPARAIRRRCRHLQSIAGWGGALMLMLTLTCWRRPGHYLGDGVCGRGRAGKRGPGRGEAVRAPGAAASMTVRHVWSYSTSAWGT